jgi:alpha-tubulin suppressor-like RCC1 family protein
MYKSYIYFFFSILLVACGGGSGGGSENTDAIPPVNNDSYDIHSENTDAIPPVNNDSYDIHVVSSNLNGSVNITVGFNNKSVDLIISDPIFYGNIGLSTGDAYELSISSSTNDQICEVTSGVNGAVTDSKSLQVLVLCKPAHKLTIGTFNIPGDVKVMLSTGEENIVPTGTASFTFESNFDYLEADNVELKILATPEGYGCSVNRLTAVASLRDTARPPIELYCFLLDQKIIDISANIGSFAALREDGTVFTWGSVGSGSDTTFELRYLHGVEKLSKAPYSKGLAYTAIYNDGSIKSWGGSAVIGSDSSQVENLLPNTEEVYSNGFSQVAHTNDNRLIGWGSELYGGDVRLSLASPVHSVFQTLGAYAAILENTRVVAWGSPQFGGDTTEVDNDLNNIIDIVSTLSGFAALKYDRTIVTWPTSELVTPDYSDLPKLINIDKLVASRSAFVAILQTGEIVVWGSIGGDLRLLNSEILSSEQWAENQVEVEDVIANGEAYAILYKNRTATAFGSNEFGADYESISSQLINIKLIVGLNNTVAGAFAALRYDGTVVTWGDVEAANSSAVANELTNVKDIFHNDFAFVALKEDGSVVAWGDPIRGGDISQISQQLINVEKIYATTSAFAALKSDGSVITWGDPDEGGDSSQLKTQLNRL